jgi:hypothetical protein
MSTKRFRLRFTFWLDMLKEGEAEIAETIEDLKANREFARTIREGIQLITSLREGNIDLLFQMFPWIQPEMLRQFREMGFIPDTVSQSEHPETKEPQPARTPISEPNQRASEALQREKQHIKQLRAEQTAYERELEQWAQEREEQIAEQWEHIEREKERLAAERERNQSAIEKKLEKLEQLLIEQGNRPIERPSAGRGGGPRPLGGSGPQQLGANNLPPPTFDDEEDATLLEVKESEGGESNASMNFIRSVQRLMEL